MLNRCILIGRLTKDPDLQYTPNGVAVAKFTLAVDRQFKNPQGEKETDFIPIVVWQKQAENAANYLGKGSLVAVDGRLQIRTYEKDGQKHWVTEVIAESVRFLDKKKDSAAPAQTAQNMGNEIGFNDEDVPF